MKLIPFTDALKLQAQPTENTCGQTCVAMLAGIPVDDVVRVMGDSGTHLYELRYQLDKYSIVTSKKCTARAPEAPNYVALVGREMIYAHRLVKHWSIWHPHDGVLYDPAHGNVQELKVCTFEVAKFYRVERRVR